MGYRITCTFIKCLGLIKSEKIIKCTDELNEDVATLSSPQGKRPERLRLSFRTQTEVVRTKRSTQTYETAQNIKFTAELSSAAFRSVRSGLELLKGGAVCHRAAQSAKRTVQLDIRFRSARNTFTFFFRPFKG